MRNKVGAFMVIDVFERRTVWLLCYIGICCAGEMDSIDYACRFRQHMTTLTFSRLQQMLLIFFHRCDGSMAPLHSKNRKMDNSDTTALCVCEREPPCILHKQFGRFCDATKVENSINTAGVIKNNQNGNTIVTLCYLVGAWRWWWR